MPSQCLTHAGRLCSWQRWRGPASTVPSLQSLGNFNDTEAGSNIVSGTISWGRMYNGTDGITRDNPIAIGVSGLTVDAGLSTFPTIQRRGDFGEGKTGAIRSRKPVADPDIIVDNTLPFYP